MRLPLLSLVAFVSSLSVLFACTDPAKDAPKAAVSDAPASDTAQAVTPPAGADAAAPAPAMEGATRYTFSQDGSTLHFVGAKVTASHDGGFKTFSGTIDVSGDKGAVTVDIDMGSLFIDSDKLADHLKSPDFFDVAKFPKATFQSTQVARGADGKSTVTGNLTLKDVTKVISFPAVINVEGDTVSAVGEFSINRKDFGIVYPGKPDDLIRDDVLIKLNIKAKKA
jgi:polyisoprenoid-binding protein YceI